MPQAPHLHAQSTPEALSLYQCICGAIQGNGTLPRDFSLPRPERDHPQALRFADGAYDGISLYHMAPDKRDTPKLLCKNGNLICSLSKPYSHPEMHQTDRSSQYKHPLRTDKLPDSA